MVFVRFWREVHLVNNLKANLFINIDVIDLKYKTVDMRYKTVIFESYNIEILIDIKT